MTEIILISNTVLGFGPLTTRKIEVLECVQRRAMDLIKGFKQKSHKEQLRELGLFSLEKRGLKGDLTVLYNCMKGGCSQARLGLSSHVTSDRMRS